MNISATDCMLHKLDGFVKDITRVISQVKQEQTQTIQTNLWLSSQLEKISAERLELKAKLDKMVENWSRVHHLARKFDEKYNTTLLEFFLNDCVPLNWDDKDSDDRNLEKLYEKCSNIL